MPLTLPKDITHLHLGTDDNGRTIFGPPVGDEYEPLDARTRRETYERFAGQWSAGWPVPLTLCTLPAARKAA